MPRRSFYLLLIILLLVMGLFACKPALLHHPDPAFQTTHQWLTEHQASITYGLPDQTVAMEQAFKQGFILVYGEGLPKKESEHAGQRRLTATRAAEVVAQRNLAVVLSDNGKYASARFDTFNFAITTPLRDFEVVNREYNNDLGKAAVLLKFDLRGAKSIQR